MTIQPLAFKRTPLQRFWFWLFRLLGWNGQYIDPGADKYVIVVWPHTSNWDFFIGFIYSRAFPVPFPNFLIKDSIINGPFGPIVRWLGGIPVDRSKSSKFVDQLAEEFARRGRMVLAITPEGTRGKTQYWKSGFYYVALAAKVPIVLAAVDYGRRFISFGQSIMPTGDLDADMEYIRSFLGDATGRHPQRQGDIGVRPKR
ncbi:MAG: 1-acyl-sn-glycerol-3-phosphate acyltransferase [Caldilineaceae bacterium]|nr:1-acyl-sn-glycerol-3-phosphate acyltransferase [Caldilineaceae bacterium]